MAYFDGMVGGKMEIWTILKANIRHKKGAFISIIVMMLLIAMSLTAIVSVKDNAGKSAELAYEQTHTGDVTLFIQDTSLSDKLLQKVKGHSMVESVEDYRTVCSYQAEVNGVVDGNSWYLLKLRDEYRVLKPDLSGYEENTPPLKKGEIYVPQGALTKLKCSLGDTIKISTIGGTYRFKIKGIVVEPVNGASVIGWKQVFISDEDFARVQREAKEKEDKNTTADCHVLQIYKSDSCNLTSNAFKRQVNLDTGIVDHAVGTLTKDMAQHYTNLFPEIIFSILTVFIGFLLVIVLIVMGHSISTGIEMDYVNLGILKAQGFSKGKIRSVFLLQYLLAECIGVVIGVVFAIPLISVLGNVFWTITAIPMVSEISAGKCLLMMAGILLLSGIFILVLTRKVSKISPVRAISGGQSEIYFDSRIKTPIGKSGLSASLALRQFIASKRRYIGTILIVSILVFFMMSIMMLGNVVNSKSAIESMGEIYAECDITFKEKASDKDIKNIEKTVKKYSAIEKKYYLISEYVSINGGENMCMVYKNPEVLTTLKGRAPLYDNEIVVTEILAEELGLKMGDEVRLSRLDKKAKYIISGIYQSLTDTGMVFAMSLEGGKKLGINHIYYGGYSLSDPEKAEEIAKALNKKFPKLLEAEAITEESGDDVYQIAIDAMKAVIYAFSTIFAFVVVTMVCTKTFMQEKKDIGIYKALGFTSTNLRVQFAVRFLIVAAIGSAIGTTCCVLFSGKLLSTLLRGIGITHLAVDYTLVTFLLPVLLICGCFFVFAFFVSRKIRKVEVRGLVTE